MALEAHFTPIGSEVEQLFTVVDSEGDEQYILFSPQQPSLSIRLLLVENIFKLAEENPFVEAIDIVNERLVGLSLEWIEQRSTGFENSAGAGDIGGLSYSPRDIFVENKPFSLHQLVELIEAGDIELDPDFQRNFIWDKTRQSRLIESLLLGLPLPSIYLSQYEDGRLTVVDGVQRLTTIKNFLRDGFRITNPEYLADTNGLNFSQLSNVLSPLAVRRFSQTQIMCFVIDYRSPQRLKFDLFKRLNTTGKPLNSQEIRNSLSRIHVQRALRNMISLESFRNATGNSVSDKRMDARDAALRFLYFHNTYFRSPGLDGHLGPLDTALDTYIDILNEMDEDTLSTKIRIYDNTLQNAFYLFGDQTFRKVFPETLNGRKFPVNKLFMMVLSVLLSQFRFEHIISNNERNRLTVPFANFVAENHDAFSRFSRATDQRQNIVSGFELFEQFLSENLNHGQS